MSKTQKIIKYFAIALAFFIIVNIFFGIAYGIKAIYYIFNDDKENIKVETLNIDDINVTNISSIEIEIDSFDLSIKSGETFKIETNNDKVKVHEKLGRLVIEEKINNWFSSNDDKLIIYIPNDLNIKDLSLKTGAGQVVIDDLTIENLYLNLGAGKAEIDNLNVSKKSKIDGGAGELKLKNSAVNNLDLDIGVGKVSIIAQLLGNSEINAGIGQLNITLLGSLDDYRIEAEKGIGTFTISEVEVKNEKTYGNGNNKIEIDGGIGEINVDFQSLN